MREVREHHDAPERIESKVRMLTPEERTKILSDCKLLSKEERIEIIMGCTERTRPKIEKRQNKTNDVIEREEEVEVSKKPIDVREVYRMYYIESLSQKRIAEHFGYKGVSSICRLFRSLGWNTRPSSNRRISVDAQEVYRLYFDERLSIASVARRLGLKSDCAIRRTFKQEEWQCRDRGKKYEIDPNEVQKLYFEENLSVRAIADSFRCRSTSPIRRIFREEKWKAKPRAAFRKDIPPTEVHRLYYEEQLSQVQVAERFGYKSQKPVFDIMRKMGWNARPHSTAKKDLDPVEVYKLYYEEGRSLQEVAKHFGYKSRAPVERVLRINGWKPKPPPTIPRTIVSSDEVYRLYFEEEQSLQKVAELFGYKSTGPVKRVLREND